VTSALAKQGIRLLSATEPIDNTPVGRFLEAVFAANAQLDNDIKADRTKEYMRRRLREGIWVWKPPLGYLSGKKLGEDKKARPDTPDPRAFPILQKIWKEYLRGMLTHTEVARRLTQSGLRHPLYPQLVRKIFSNKYYAGILVDPWSKEEIEGRHQPMVTRSEFARTQALLAGKSPWIVAHVKRREEFPLRGFVSCAVCSVPYTASWARGRHAHYAYYHCWGRTCPERGRSVRVLDLHDEFVDNLKRVTPDAKRLKTLREALQDAFQGRLESLRGRRAEAEKTVARLQEAKSALIDMRRRGLLTDAEFLEEKERLNQELGTTETSATALPEYDEALRDGIDLSVQMMQEFPSVWRDMQVEPKQRFQRLVFPQGIPYRRNEGFGTAPVGLLYSLAGASGKRSSEWVHPSSASWNRIALEILEWSAYAGKSRRIHTKTSKR